MSIECHNTFTPIELDLHEAVKVGVIFSSRKVIMSLDVSICLRLDSWEEISNLVCSVVMNVSESFDF
jgi:hypothetical protein